MRTEKIFGILLIVIGMMAGQAAFVASSLLSEMDQAVDNVQPLLDTIVSSSMKISDSLATLRDEMEEVSPQKECDTLVKSGPVDSIDRPVCALKPAIDGGMDFFEALLPATNKLRKQFDEIGGDRRWVNLAYVMASILVIVGAFFALRGVRTTAPVKD